MDSSDSIPSWSLPTLIGAFVDLTIAYVLLLGSLFFHLVTLTLSLFRLRLPLPSSSLLSFRLHRLFVSSPRARITAVQAESLARLPFRPVDGGGVEESPVLEAVEEEEWGDREEEEEEEEERRKSRARRRRWRGKRKELDESSWSVGSGADLQPLPAPGSFRSMDTRGYYPLPGNVEYSGSGSNTNSDGTFEWEIDKYKVVEQENVEETKRSDAETIRILEEALEKEQSARSALYVELEKERSSAASAADEAMAMIERLQKEKAAVLMDARQYERIAEEKYEYDEEEMELLKDIVVKQERELYVLRQEVETYRNSGDNLLPYENPNITVDMSKAVGHSPFELEKNPMATVQEISTSNEREETMKYQTENTDGPNTHEDNLDFQEKGIVSVDVYTSNRSHASDVVKDNLARMDESCDQDLNKAPSFIDGGAVEEQNNNVPDRRKREGLREINGSSHLEPDLNTLDVHVIDNEVASCRKRNGKNRVPTVGSQMGQSECQFTPKPYGIRDIEISSGSSGTSLMEEQNVCKTAVGLTSVRRSLDSSLARVASPFDHSISLVDVERTKLENEVEGLRHRLRVVQQGREKLNFSMEQMQRENLQMQLLQDIASQLQDIKQLADTKNTHRASLPLPLSKVHSQKRRCRSGSSVHESN